MCEPVYRHVSWGSSKKKTVPKLGRVSQGPCGMYRHRVRIYRGKIEQGLGKQGVRWGKLAEFRDSESWVAPEGSGRAAVALLEMVCTERHLIAPRPIS